MANSGPSLPVGSWKVMEHNYAHIERMIEKPLQLEAYKILSSCIKEAYEEHGIIFATRYNRGKDITKEGIEWKYGENRTTIAFYCNNIYLLCAEEGDVQLLQASEHGCFCSGGQELVAVFTDIKHCHHIKSVGGRRRGGTYFAPTISDIRDLVNRAVSLIKES